MESTKQSPYRQAISATGQGTGQCLGKTLGILSTDSAIHRIEKPLSWSPPGANSYKVNYDGATFAEDNTTGMGVIIRNNEGLAMALLSQKIPLRTTVIEVEVLVARRALELALELGFDSIVLGSLDSETLFKALKLGNTSLAPYGHLVQDILYLSSHFSNFQISLLRQLGNKVAHSLARKAKLLNYMIVWIEDVPDLLHVLQADSNSLP
ncbi:uncharacterized protein LOC142639941 [Castanea sativa]|uniref:uncharacterized protein LOC142639941 n=1 Tax=Castanea sativa TaxID=21020 RepID=UPI003F650A90